jgi:hypothetical protein
VLCSQGGYVTEKSSLVGNSKFLFDIQSLIYCINKIVRKSETKAIKSLEEISSLLTWKERNGPYSFNWRKNMLPAVQKKRTAPNETSKDKAHPNKPLRKDRTASPSGKESLYHSRKD